MRIHIFISERVNQKKRQFYMSQISWQTYVHTQQHCIDWVDNHSRIITRTHMCNMMFIQRQRLRRGCNQTCSNHKCCGYLNWLCFWMFWLMFYSIKKQGDMFFERTIFLSNIIICKYQNTFKSHAQNDFLQVANKIKYCFANNMLCFQCDMTYRAVRVSTDSDIL